MSNYWIVIAIFFILLDMTLWYIFPNIFLFKRIHERKFNVEIITIIGACLLAVIYQQIIMHFNAIAFSLGGIPYVVIAIALTFTLFEGSIWQKLFYPVLLYVIMYISDYTSIFIIQLFSSYNTAILITGDAYQLYAMILSRLLIIMTVLFLKSLKLKRNSILDNKLWRQFFIIFLILLFVIIFTFPYGKIEFNMNVFIASTLMILILLLVGAVYYIQKREEYELNILQNNISREHFRQMLDLHKAMQDTEKSIRILRHDANKHIFFMKNMEDMSEKERYYEELQEKYKVDTIFTGNYDIDAIIFRYKPILKDLGINLSIDGSIPMPGKIPFSSVDLNIILSNAFENAINACKKVSNSKKELSLIISYNPNLLYITLINPTSDQPLTFFGKKVDEEHGIGLNAIRKTVEENFGVMKYKIQDNSFYLTIMIQHH